jgi:hypothetical protein
MSLPKASCRILIISSAFALLVSPSHLLGEDRARDPATLARNILDDDGRSDSERKKIIAEHPGMALPKDSQRMSALLDAVETGRVKRAELGPHRVEKLTHSTEPAIRARAQRLLNANGN